MARKRLGYKLVVKPLANDEFQCSLRAEPPYDSHGPTRARSTPVSSISGWRMKIAMGYIRRTLKDEGYKPSYLKRSRSSPFQLGEHNGAKLDLMFRAIRDLQKRSKIEDVIMGIEAMSREEALYWHAKVEQDNGKTEKKGLKALRMLLGGE